MRYLVMHKVDAAMEAGAPPNQAIVEGMGTLVRESLAKGIFLNGAGLHRSARRARVKTGGGAPSVERGPYEGRNELVASLVMLRARSMDGAVAHAERLSSLLGGIEVEVGPIVEPWDIGLMERPSGKVPEQFLLLCKLTAADERGERAGKEHRRAAETLGASLGDDGVVLAAESLGPSARGARLGAPSQGKRGWVDGPFAESKELIAGFSLLGLPSRAEALAWADRYAAILGHNEVDFREVND